MPGAELVLRVRDIAPSPDTLVVVNCAGRTRSIIGAQSLINAGVPNKVVALRNGTMGWHLAGLTCASGKTRRTPDYSGKGLAWAKAAAEGVAGKFGVERIDRATLDSVAQGRDAHDSMFSTCAIRPNTKPAICPARSPRPADNWCRRPTNMPARSAPASSWSTTARCAR